ncbi:MAG TPA: agmatine deiminase family protein [Bacteroidales bacterium]
MRKKYLLFILVVGFLVNTNLYSQDSKPDWRKLHYLSEEEMNQPFDATRDFYETDPPEGPVRNVAEYDQMQAVLVRYPFGIPLELVREMAEDIEVVTLVANASQQQTVLSQYENANVNTDNCSFLIAPTDSYWTRDYGPWFVFDGNDEPGIVNFPYNRPRPNDNDVPIRVSEMLGIDLYGMNLIETGGNYMTDGMGKSASTDLVLDENPTLTQEDIDELVLDYLGVNQYSLRPDPLDDYIKHIDCWGKFLGPGKVIIGQVPQSDYRYDDFEAAANFFATSVSSLGKPYKVYRVYTPATSFPYTPYTNSLILNKKVLVPVSGNQWDDEAIESYQEAMPGYEIIGINYSGWIDTDALHCRTKGIADLGMLYIHHVPILGLAPVQDSYELTAEITAASGQPLLSDSVLIYYSVNGGDYMTSTMTHETGKTWTGSITGVDGGDQVSYYLFAKDNSERRAFNPYIGQPDPYKFTIFGTQTDDLSFDPDSVVFSTVDELYEGIPLDIINEKNHPVIIDYISPEDFDVWIWFVEEMPELPYVLEAHDTLSLRIMSAIPVKSFDSWLVDTMFVQVQNDVYEVPIVFNSAIISAQIENEKFEAKVFPNPFNEKLVFEFEVKNQENVRLFIYDASGKMIYKANKNFLPGKQKIIWNSNSLEGKQSPAGSYFYQLFVGEKQKSGKVILSH